jgi:sporulation-control protein
MTVITELAARPGTGDRQHLSTTDIDGLTSREGGWIAEVDRWIVNALDKLASGAPTARGSGAFLQPHQQGYGQPQHQQGYGQPQHQPYGAPGYGHGRPGQHGYAYSGHGGHHGDYKYSGYHGKPGMGMGGAIAAGVGGAALGFLGGMMISDMIGDAMAPDLADAAGAAEAAGFEEAGFEDFGGGFEEF